MASGKWNHFIVSAYRCPNICTIYRTVFKRERELNPEIEMDVVYGVATYLFFFFFIGDAVTNNFCCSGCLTKTYRLHPIKKVEKYDMHFMGKHQGYTCVAPHLHTWRHFQSIPYDTCSKMILWCWCSWRQRDSCPCLSGTPQYLNVIYNYSLKWTSFLILVFFSQSCERLKEIQGNETKFAKWVNLHV